MTAEPGLVRPYATDAPITPTQPQRRGGWTDFTPRAPLIGVSWGENPPYAMVARIRAGAYADMNGLLVVDWIANCGADPTAARLYDVAERCAYAWHGGRGWAWWLVSGDDIPLNVVDRIKARQRREWSQTSRPRPPDRLPPALEPVSYRRVAS